MSPTMRVIALRPKTLANNIPPCANPANRFLRHPLVKNFLASRLSTYDSIVNYSQIKFSLAYVLLTLFHSSTLASRALKQRPLFANSASLPQVARIFKARGRIFGKLESQPTIYRVYIDMQIDRRKSECQEGWVGVARQELN
jgi:hypothetical protein